MILSRKRGREWRRHFTNSKDGMKTSSKDLQQNLKEMVKSHCSVRMKHLTRSCYRRIVTIVDRSIRRHPTIYLQSVSSKNN